MGSEERLQWTAIGAGVFVYICAIILSRRFGLRGIMEFFLFFSAYILTGYPAFQKIVDYLNKKQYFNETILIVVASAGAMGIGRYIEAVAVILMFSVAGIIEDKAVHRSRKFIRDFIDIRPVTATRKVRGKEVQVDPSELKARNIVIVKPGERVPIDGIVTAGSTTLDTQALTGESMPREAAVGDRVFGGSINLTGLIEIRVTKTYQESTVSRIMKLVEEAAAERNEEKTPVRKFMRWYTPIVTAVAVLIAVVPSLSFAWGHWHEWIYRGLIFLVAACPCGLLVSEPLAFLGGIAAAARHGVIVKGGQFLEYLSQADTFIFDKTGTLTEGTFVITDIEPARPEELSREELLRYAAYAESYSSHPIAQSLLEAYGQPVDKKQVKSVKESAGFGVSATVDGHRVHIGNRRMMKKQKVQYPYVESGGTVIYVVIDKEYAGYLVAEDQIKESAFPVLEWLREKRNAVLVMLTGDRRNVAASVMEALDMDYGYANLLPEEKLERLKEFMELEGDTEKVAFVGDGINDAPVLAQADVGIAMGAFGSDAAVEAADVVLMDDDLEQIPSLVNLSGETLQVVRGNLILACVIKALVLGLCLAGLIELWAALTADLAVMFLSLGNAMSIIRYPVD
ncbi:MAG TPA: cadmium-translocating P-type ATPase [Candidatus Bariatricus faecipullorum]|nr:cadmium-translocating P-type ATPase [Candidatus Bariatricus faecipullorum]